MKNILQSTQGIQLAQNFRFIPVINTGVLRNRIGNIAAILRCDQPKLYTVGWIIHHLKIIGIECVCFPTHSACTERVCNTLFLDFLNNAGHKRLKLLQSDDSASILTVNKNTDIITVGFKDLFNFYNCSHSV